MKIDRYIIINKNTGGASEFGNDLILFDSAKDAYDYMLSFINVYKNFNNYNVVLAEIDLSTVTYICYEDLKKTEEYRELLQQTIDFTMPN